MADYRVIYREGKSAPRLIAYGSLESCRKDFEEHPERTLIHPPNLDGPGLNETVAEELFADLNAEHERAKAERARNGAKKAGLSAKV